MCFSAPVSFGAAAVLAAVGAVSIGSAKARNQIPVAAIPLLFAAQQAFEGVLWLVLERTPHHVSTTWVGRGFLFFALFVWPAYVPAAFAFVERDRRRRALLVGCALAGCALGAYLLGCATFKASDACIAFGNLYYWVQIDTSIKHVAPFVYIALIALPLVVSSLRGTSWLAALALASFTATGLLYRAGFVSVWCFFACVISGVVALVVRSMPERFA